MSPFCGLEVSAETGILRLECRWVCARWVQQSPSFLLQSLISYFTQYIRLVKLGGYFLCMAIEDEAVNSGKRVQLGLRSGAWARHVGDARAIHCSPQGAVYAPLRQAGVSV